RDRVVRVRGDEARVAALDGRADRRALRALPTTVRDGNFLRWGRHSCLPRTPADRKVCPTTVRPASTQGARVVALPATTLARFRAFSRRLAHSGMGGGMGVFWVGGGGAVSTTGAGGAGSPDGGAGGASSLAGSVGAGCSGGAAACGACGGSGSVGGVG